MTPLKLNKCKIRVGDKITALYIGNPQGENYTDSGEQTNVIKVTDEEGNTYNLIDSFGHHNTYKNSVFTGGDIYDVGSQSHIIADWSLIKIVQRLVFGGNDSMDTNRNLILYFTEPLKIASAPTSNSHFDEDFQGIVAFTNTDRVNTGTFDPTSDNPAGQKSIAKYSVAKADLDEFTKTFYDNCDVALYMNKELRSDSNVFSQQGVIRVPYVDKVTNLASFCQGATARSQFDDGLRNIIVPDIKNIVNGNLMFNRVSCPSIIFNNITVDGCEYMFSFCRNLTKIVVAEGKTAKMQGNCWGAFYSCPTIEEIGPFDFSDINTYGPMFASCISLKKLHCKHFRLSFDISASTAFEQADLVEIISNLDPVSNAQILTMGSTNLAKLTQEQILVATGKGWTLA